MHMKLTFNYIDLNKAREFDMAPEDIIPRDDGRAWLMLDSPIILDGPQDPNKIWRYNYNGKFIRVALLPYCSIGLDPENALSHSLAIGFKAATQISSLNRNYSIERLHLSIGNPIEELEKYLDIGGKKVDCFRYWLGISVKVV